MSKQEEQEFLRFWFEYSRVDIENDEVTVEVQGRKFVAPLSAFVEVNPWEARPTKKDEEE